MALTTEEIIRALMAQYGLDDPGGDTFQEGDLSRFRRDPTPPDPAPTGDRPRLEEGDLGGRQTPLDYSQIGNGTPMPAVPGGTVAPFTPYGPAGAGASASYQGVPAFPALLGGGAIPPEQMWGKDPATLGYAPADWVTAWNARRGTNATEQDALDWYGKTPADERNRILGDAYNELRSPAPPPVDTRKTPSPDAPGSGPTPGGPMGTGTPGGGTSAIPPPAEPQWAPPPTQAPWDPYAGTGDYLRDSGLSSLAPPPSGPGTSTTPPPLGPQLAPGSDFGTGSTGLAGLAGSGTEDLRRRPGM